MKKEYDIAAYIWPAYTNKEPRTKIFWPIGIGEWETVEKQMDVKPLWGFNDEANPKIMQKQIEEASSYGINTFIYDWYWYDNRPFLEQCLDDGFLKANNNEKMKFYIMWANHDANYLWDIRNSEKEDVKNTVIWQGKINFEQFMIIVDRWIEKYFSKSNYYKIDGKPIISIYDINNFINSFGGIEETKKALEWFRKYIIEKGFKGIHVQFIKWGNIKYNFDDKEYSFYDLIDILKIDSVSHYQFCHFLKLNRDYKEVYDDLEQEYNLINKNIKVPYFPHVSVGWNSSPRFYHRKINSLNNVSKEDVKKAFEIAKNYSNKNNENPLITINSWNEWTECSYLQPDSKNEYNYLEAIKEVFK